MPRYLLIDGYMPLFGGPPIATVQGVGGGYLPAGGCSCNEVNGLMDFRSYATNQPLSGQSSFGVAWTTTPGKDSLVVGPDNALWCPPGKDCSNRFPLNRLLCDAVVVGIGMGVFERSSAFAPRIWLDTPAALASDDQQISEQGMQIVQGADEGELRFGYHGALLWNEFPSTDYSVVIRQFLGDNYTQLGMLQGDPYEIVEFPDNAAANPSFGENTGWAGSNFSIQLDLGGDPAGTGRTITYVNLTLGCSE